MKINSFVVESSGESFIVLAGKIHWEKKTLAEKKQWLRDHPYSKFKKEVQKAIKKEEREIKKNGGDPKKDKDFKKTDEAEALKAQQKKFESNESDDVDPDKIDTKATKPLGTMHRLKAITNAATSAKEKVVGFFKKQMGDAKTAGTVLDKMSNGEDLTDEEKRVRDKALKVAGVAVLASIAVSVVAFTALAPFALILGNEYLNYKNAVGDSEGDDDDEDEDLESDLDDDDDDDDEDEGQKTAEEMREGDDDDDDDDDQEPLAEGETPDYTQYEEQKKEQSRSAELSKSEDAIGRVTKDMSKWLLSQDPEKLALVLSKKHPELAKKEDK